jgi:hypothetical protein
LLLPARDAVGYYRGEPTFEFVTIYGLGAATLRAVQLALRLIETSGERLRSDTTTGTTLIVDHYEPLEEVCLC